jgi:amidase
MGWRIGSPCARTCGEVDVESLRYASATELARLLRERQISSEALVRAHLDRTCALNPVLNGMAALAAEEAMECAVACDRALAERRVLGALHGVPFTVKDVYAIGPSTRFELPPGAAVGPLPAAEVESTAVRRLRAAGAVLLGVSRATLWSDREERYGPARNPYDIRCTPGGSSGGETVLIAAGCSVFGLGSDSGGSLRQPAHFCGLVALRPSNGRVPRGTDPDANDPRTVAGPIARYVGDVALALALAGGHDWADPWSLPMPCSEPGRIPLQGLKVAWHASNGIVAPTAETEACVLRAAAALERAGARLVEQSPPELPSAWQLTLDYWRHLRKEGSLSEYFAFQERWERYRTVTHAWMSDWDLILCPVEAFPAPRSGSASGATFTYTAPYSLVGWPCAVVPAGNSAQSLPIGVQLVAGPWRDDVVLAAAQCIESALGGFRPPSFTGLEPAPTPRG